MAFSKAVGTISQWAFRFPFSHMCTYISALSHARHAAASEPSALAGYQRYTGWNYLTSSLYRQYNFRNFSPLAATLHMLVQRTQALLSTNGILKSQIADCSTHADLAPIHCCCCKRKPFKARELPRRDAQLCQDYISEEVSATASVSTQSPATCHRGRARRRRHHSPPGLSLEAL